MAYSLVQEQESGEMERVFSVPIDPVAGHFRLLYVDPLDLGDTADVILISFDDMPVWGTA